MSFNTWIFQNFTFSKILLFGSDSIISIKLYVTFTQILPNYLTKNFLSSKLLQRYLIWHLPSTKCWDNKGNWHIVVTWTMHSGPLLHTWSWHLKRWSTPKCTAIPAVQCWKVPVVFLFFIFTMAGSACLCWFLWFV